MPKYLTGFCLVFVSTLMATALFAATPQVTAQNASCLQCHDDPDLAPRTLRGKTRDIYVSGQRYEKSVHEGLACASCHQTVEKDGKTLMKTGQKAEEIKSCLECHTDYFQKVESNFSMSVHAKKLGNAFDCASCHDPHLVQKEDASMPSAERIRFDNNTCITCHSDLVGYKALSGKEVWQQDLSHSFLPFKDEHFEKVRCIECHTPSDGDNRHTVLPKEEALKDCTSCHSQDSLLVARTRTPTSVDAAAGEFLGKGLFDDSVLLVKLAKTTRRPQPTAHTASVVDDLGFINNGLFKNSYLIGATRNLTLDSWAFKALLATLAGIVFHGGLRFVASRKRKSHTHGRLHSEYVYDLNVRILHWTNALLFLALMASGFNLHFGGNLFDFARSVAVHHAAGGLLVINYLCFVILSIALGNIKHYIPRPRKLLTRWCIQARYYLWGIFKGEPHPYGVTRAEKFNPLQQATYLPVMYLFLPLLILSGIWMFFPELTPESILGFPGRWVTATVHYLLAVGFTLFLVGHLYLCTTGDKITALIKGMFTGYHSSRH